MCLSEIRKGSKNLKRLVNLYLYSIIMNSICWQRLHNTHVTVGCRKTEDVTENTSCGQINGTRLHLQIFTRLLYNSLPSGLPTELFIMLYDPILTVRQQNKGNNWWEQMKGKTWRKGFLENELLPHQYARDGWSFKAWVGSAGNFFRSDLVASLLGKSKPKKNKTWSTVVACVSNLMRKHVRS